MAARSHSKTLQQSGACFEVIKEGAVRTIGIIGANAMNREFLQRIQVAALQADIKLVYLPQRSV